ncbi:hypothetical protein CLIB1444_06S05842 [[Candida] jaroonii]|uniref:Uncharacterized protein n=1 Tax=[Candida] jaroonii TaxID=467808 RepID=A0ACA9Y990_9ASCO|nr:hypothetical protein CLIB1444_06S05842 [[Candida] jaroonii]
MADSNSLAVGLAVGVPSFIIIVIMVLFYIRFRRKQKKEDNSFESDDNHSFNLFSEEIHKGSNHSSSKSNSFKREDMERHQKSIELGSVSEEGSPVRDQESDTKVVQERDLGTPGTPGTPGIAPTYAQGTPGTPGTFSSTFNGPKHSKNNSVYDFYETFIPILPPKKNSNSQVSTSQNSSLSNFNILHLNSDKEKDKERDKEDQDQLDNLAKQLNNHFEKLPTSLSKKPFNGERDLKYSNDKYKESKESVGKADDPNKDNKLSNILGGNFDNSFQNENNESGLDVVFK